MLAVHCPLAIAVSAFRLWLHCPRSFTPPDYSGRVSQVGILLVKQQVSLQLSLPRQALRRPHVARPQSLYTMRLRICRLRLSLQVSCSCFLVTICLWERSPITTALSASRCAIRWEALCEIRLVACAVSSQRCAGRSLRGECTDGISSCMHPV